MKNIQLAFKFLNMKKHFWIVFVLLCNSVFSKNGDSLKLPNTYYYFGLGASNYYQIALNSTLSSNNLPQIKKSDIAVFLGFDFNKKMLGLNMETSLYSSVLNNPNKIRFVAFPLRLGINGNLYGDSKYAFSVNVNYNYTGYFASIYYGNNIVNSNNISASNGSVLELSNNTQNIGFQIIFRCILMKKTPVIKIGYDIALKKSRWYSRNNLLESFPSEKINKIYFSLCLPIKTKTK